MSGAAMKLTAAATGFIVFLLSVKVIQSEDDWGVSYTSTNICALEGSTVNISCSYTYPSSGNNDGQVEVERAFWFTKLQDNEPVDLRTDPKYAGRVQYHCHENFCTLTITDLIGTDSELYKFRFMTNEHGGRFIGLPGVFLSVTGLQAQISSSSSLYNWATLECHSRCHLPDHPPYIWYKNGKKMQESTSYEDNIYAADSYSCALKGREDLSAPSACVRGKSCKRVTYTERRICAFRGSSVDISCTYDNNNNNKYITSKFWFSPERHQQWQTPSQPEDLSEDSQYAGRVRVSETGRGRSTLTISDLTDGDSAQYLFKFRTKNFEWGNSSLGTTLTVIDPDLQVQVIWTSTGPKLVCHSSCLQTGRSYFVWYKNDMRIREGTSFSYRGYVDPTGRYSCAYKGYRSAPVYAPGVPSVSLSPSAEIVEGSLVILTCSSDANPPAKYTWYKENQKLLNEESPVLVFSSIQSSDSGQYYCRADNELERKTSGYTSIDVKYAPKTSEVSVSPSAEIVEGSSVTLTCSSDANPAANYTWYKENQTLTQGPEGRYHFAYISSEDSGVYHCESGNQYGSMNSTSLFLDVQYAPKLPSVSVSLAEIVEGSSVNLTCSSDANPAANYTWYKQDEESPKASGQIFTITDFSSEHSGNYYCEAQNTRGRQNSTSYLIVAAGRWKSAATGTITVFLLVIIVLAVFLWIRTRNKSFKQQCNGGERPDNRAQLNMGPMYDVPPAAVRKHPAERQDELLYSSLRFPQNQNEDALYSNIRPTQGRRKTEEEEEEDGVEYTVVKPDDGSSASGRRSGAEGEDVFALYSTVNK